MSKIDLNKPLPSIKSRKIVAKSNLFRVESIDLEFSNGAERTFERMAGSGSGAVMVVPLIDDEHFLLIREYAAGTHSYELGFPKGLVDRGEEVKTAANRELQEEIGYAARSLSLLHSVRMAPTFFSATMSIFLGTDLYASELQGDEPEPLDVIKWSRHDIPALLARPDFTEARCIAALLLMEKALQSQTQ